MIRLSVVIPAHDRSHTLPAALAPLKTQTIPTGEFELLVVDDGSSEQQRSANHYAVGMRRALAEGR